MRRATLLSARFVDARIDDGGFVALRRRGHAGALWELYVTDGALELFVRYAADWEARALNREVARHG